MDEPQQAPVTLLFAAACVPTHARPMTSHAPTAAIALGDRSGFPQLDCAAYLNHAAISPPSAWVCAAMDQAGATFARKGVGAFEGFIDVQQQLKEALATVIGASSAADLALVPNTSHGVTTIALCFPWQRGDRVLLVDGEFPANVTPWQRAAELFGLELSWLPAFKATTEGALDPQAWLAALEAACRQAQPPRLLAISAVQFQTGVRMPLEAVSALCARYGVQLFVDGIQACGMVPLDVTALNIDYLACGSHKWMMGLPGLGLLYARPERVAALRPHTASWTSHEQAFGFLFEGPGKLSYDRPIRPQIDFVEGGMGNVVGAAAWLAALKPLRKLGADAIFAHAQGYLDKLEAGLIAGGFSSLRASSPAARSGILSVKPPSDVPVIALHGAIDAGRVSCSTPDGLLRFSPHWPNAYAEVDAVLHEVSRAVASLRS